MGQRHGRLVAERNRNTFRAPPNPHSGRFPLGTSLPILKIKKVLCDSRVWHLAGSVAEWKGDSATSPVEVFNPAGRSRRMSTAVLEAPRVDAVNPALGLLVLARAAAEHGATQSEIVRDLAPYVGHKLAPAAWRDAAAKAVASFAAQGLASVVRNRVELTDAGRDVVQKELGGRQLPRAWGEIRDVRLIARALGMEGEALARLKRLAKPDGLRAAILQRAFGLKIRGAASAARLRQALAVVALERAFGNTLKGSVGTRTGLSAKAGRLLAGQLSRKPRDFGTDSRLVAALAAEQVGAFQTDADALRTAILRNFVAQSFGTVSDPVSRSELDARSEAQRSDDRQPVEERGTVVAMPGAQRPRPLAANRPSLEGFAETVRKAASSCAEGWPGNRKAFISHVWDIIREQHPEWGITDIEFKAMLAEAHRTGHVVLAGADLKDKKNLKALQDSAVAYKNAVLHFVRVDNE